MVLEWSDLGALHNLGTVVKFAFQNLLPYIKIRSLVPSGEAVRELGHGCEFFPGGQELDERW